MQSENKTLLLFLLASIAFSCSRMDAVRLVEPKYTFNRYGRVENKPIPKDKKKVVSYWKLRGIDFDIMHTPDGKIDSLIKMNPDWAFIFYIKCNDSDTSKVVNTLDAYNQNFEAILDFNWDFAEKNALDTSLSSIGFICAPDNSILGLAVIGTTMSFFDSEFEKAKKILR